MLLIDVELKGMEFPDYHPSFSRCISVDDPVDLCDQLSSQRIVFVTHHHKDVFQ